FDGGEPGAGEEDDPAEVQVAPGLEEGTADTGPIRFVGFATGVGRFLHREGDDTRDDAGGGANVDGELDIREGRDRAAEEGGDARAGPAEGGAAAGDAFEGRLVAL